MNILFLVPYPANESPSQRFRFEQYFHLLNNRGISYSVQSFLKVNNWRIFYKPGKPLTKLAILGAGILKRAIILFSLRQYNFVFIHREAAPVGPPLFEWIISRVFKKKIIYDFDDAIWLTDRPSEPAILSILKYRSKVHSICAYSYKVSCGNKYLCDYARKFNSNVVLNPTTIDTDKTKNLIKSHSAKRNVIIGWTGSHSTLKYFEFLKDTLALLVQEFSDLEIVVIADIPPTFHLESMTFINWTRQSEIEDLLKIDIGIMPLPDNDWSQGKCGFKALQYMSLGIPAVVSPVGVNVDIVQHGISGFLATSTEEWVKYLSMLIKDHNLRESMASEGRKKVFNQYSVNSNADNFLALFE
jgi:glycosyltransferase involved in cell wall biosynthesis